MPQFVYTMKGLGKVYPPDAKVLEDIWLSFLPGATREAEGVCCAAGSHAAAATIAHVIRMNIWRIAEA